MATEITTAEDQTASLTLAPNSQAASIIANAKNERDLSDQDFAIVASIADAPPPAPALPSEKELKQLIGTMAAHLDKRKTSIDAGRLNLKIYARMLGHLPLSTLQAVTHQALATLKWMPEASELLTMAEGHLAPELKLHGRAKALTTNRRQRLFEEVLRIIKDHGFTDQELQDLTERTASVAEARGDIVIRLDGRRQYRSKEIITAHIADLKQRGDEIGMEEPADERDTRASAGQKSGSIGDLADGILDKSKERMR